VRAFAGSWQDRAFAYQETGRSKESLWIVYGLLRSWLLAKLPSKERKDAHKAAGNFLVEMDQQDQESELGLSWVDCLMEARSQFLQAKEFELARTVTDRLSGFLVRSGFYDGARQLNMELLNYEKHPSPMSWIARTYSGQGDYDSARTWYQKSIDASAGLNQEEIGVALQGLATIDVYKVDYDAAREKFEKSMKIKQQIGNRAGEAATFYQLGFLAREQGRSWEGLKLVALCCVINASIGHGDTESDFKALSGMASKLKYTQEQIEAMLKEVADSYQKDRGQSLIDAAFPKVDPDASSHQ
jgi:tetratricopeptide (TPR) repeat protein